MKRILGVLLFGVPLVLCIALGAGAQDFGPPPPLDEEYFGWLIGEWSGGSEAPMGKTKDWMKCEMGLGGQFMLMHYKIESDMGTLTGMGALTIGPDGNIKGLWMDSWRNISHGTGTRDGDQLKMVWESPMGQQTRIMKRVSDDKFVEDITMSGPDGSAKHAKSEMTRVK